ncbi:hypothetical protein [Leptospira mayottensis]|nr:hypothetical protein [Leptospira mayottensis]
MKDQKFKRVRNGSGESDLFSTNARLYYNIRQVLVKEALKENIN